jgi:hypothetical protein
MKKILQKTFQVMLLTLLSCFGMYAQTTVSYTAMTNPACPAAPVATISPAVTGLTFSQLSRGAGVTCVATAGSISGSGFNGNLATNVGASKWYTFSITSDAATAFTLNSLSIISRVSTAVGGNNVSVQYSIDAGAKVVIGSYTPTGSAATYLITPSTAIAVGASQVLNIFIIPNGLSAAGTTCRVEAGTSVNVTASAAVTAPTVTTDAAPTLLTNNSATLGGNVTATGGAAINATGFVYSQTSVDSTPTIGETNVTQLPVGTTQTGTGAFTLNTGTVLLASTQYTYRAYAGNATGGISYGAAVNFTTTSGPVPHFTLVSGVAGFGNVCTNASVSHSFTFDGADLENSGTINVAAKPGFLYSLTEVGGYQASLNIPYTGTSIAGQVVWVQFSPSAVQSYSGNIVLSGGGVASFNVAVTGSGINTPASVNTLASSAITTTSAVLGGSFSAGCTSVGSYGIAYSTTAGFGAGTAVESTNQAAGAFSVSLTNLSPNTTYYYKAYAIDGTGTVYGSESSFLTNSLAAPLAQNASSITPNSFIANWDPVSGADHYRLDVSTTSDFLALASVNVAAWTFATYSLNSDAGNANNTGANTRTLSSVNTTGITQVGSGATTAASATSWDGGSGNTYWQVADINTTGMYALTLSSDQQSSGTGPRDFKVQYKLGAAGAWIDVPGGTITVLSASSFTALTDLALPAACSNQTAVSLRWIMTSNTSQGGGTVASGGSSRLSHIYVKGKGGLFLSGFDNLLVNGTSQPVGSLSEFTNYYYRVRAESTNSTSPNSNTITVQTLHNPATITTVAQAPGFVCDGAAATFNVTGLLPNITTAITYTIGAQQTTVNVLATGTTGSFTAVLATADNGNNLTVNTVERTDFPGNPIAITGVTAALSVNANVTYYADNDTDGFGNLNQPSVTCTGIAPAGYVLNSADCDDTKKLYSDLDGDLFGSDTLVACGGVANTDDCDDSLTLYSDVDGDLFGSDIKVACGGVANTDDCDDNALLYSDVDGDLFGSDILVACGGVANTDDCDDNVTLYSDVDGDLFGSDIKVACGGVANSDDCDDTALLYSDLDGDLFGSDTLVACGGVANSDDCDDTAVRYADVDGDTYGSTVKVACGGSANNTDCNDNNNAVNPGHAEVGYNLIDDDCDGAVDEGFPPKTTVVQGGQCSTILPSIDTQLMANLVAGAQGYRWRVSTLDNSNNVLEVQELSTQLRVIKLTQLPHYAFNTKYRIEVAVYFAGFLQPFTPSTCTVTTPSPTTLLSACGQTLTTMSDVIYAGIVPFATGYRFEITEVGNAANTQNIDRSLREFRMSLVTAFTVRFGKTYQIRVAVRNTDGTYLGYGSVCNVTTPVFPTTFVQDSQCSNYAVPNNTTQIYAYSYPGAISYVFNLSLAGYETGVEVTKNLRVFTLNDFAGQPLIPGGTYNVRVRMIFNNGDPAGVYGKACTIVIPGASRQIEGAGVSFNATAWPNPSADDFNIEITTAGKASVGIKVYDMVGRMLENRQVTVNEIEALKVGSQYPSGVYNIIVSQGEETKTLRVVKR